MTFLEKQQEEAREKLPALRCGHLNGLHHTLTPEDLDSLISQVVQNTVGEISGGIGNLTPFSIGVPQDPLISKEAVHSLLKEITNTTKEE